MKYTVCYDIHCSSVVEAEDEDQAIDILTDKTYAEMIEDADDVEVTLVQDEKENIVVL